MSTIDKPDLEISYKEGKFTVIQTYENMYSGNIRVGGTIEEKGEPSTNYVGSSGYRRSYSGGCPC